jgi:hypothetical protein
MQKAKGDEASYRDQLQKIIGLDASAGSGRTARIRYLAAQSALVLSEDFYRRFDEVKLVKPFEKNLKEKKRRMDAALDAFGRLVDYEVADVTAGATYYMAEVYSEFSRALADSERPGGLNPRQLQQYEAALDEEAFPFEEKAIAVHQKNLELLATGIYNPWIEKSLGKLAILMPGRYAKFEASSGFIASVDRYAYESPKATATVATTPSPAPAPRATRSGPGRCAGGRRAMPHSLRLSRSPRRSQPPRRPTGRPPLADGGPQRQRLRHPRGRERRLGRPLGLRAGSPRLSRTVRRGHRPSRPGDGGRAESHLGPHRPGDRLRAGGRSRPRGGQHQARARAQPAPPRRVQRAGNHLPPNRALPAGARELREGAGAPPEFHFARRNLAILVTCTWPTSCALQNYELYAHAVPDDAAAAIWIADLHKRIGK